MSLQAKNPKLASTSEHEGLTSHSKSGKPASETKHDSSPAWQLLALRPAGIQAKLTISQPGDRYEQEADRVADRVMRMEAPAVSGSKPQFETVQRMCAECEDEEDELQRKEQGPDSRAIEAAPSIVHETLSSQGGPLDSTTRDFMESRFGHDFGNVRVHTDARADAAARHVNSLAFTLGNDVAFREGQFSPNSDQGRRLLAHELTHVVQQSAGSRTPSIQKQEAKPASAAAPVLRPDPLRLESTTATGVASAVPTFIYNTRGDIIAIVNQGTQLKITGKPKDEALERVSKGEFWARPEDKQSGLFDLYYEVEYFGRMGRKTGQLKDDPIKGYVLSNMISLTARPAGPSQAMTANDWMTVIPDAGKKGDAAAITTSALAIEAELQAIERRPFSVVKKKLPEIPRDGLMSKADARIQDYRTWLDAPDTRPSLAKSTKDIRWVAFYKLFDAEGDPSKIMTYDKTNITWGVGFSGSGNPGVGLTEQMMARLFNQSPESRDAFWRSGITVVGTEMVAVKIINAAAGKAEKLRGTKAENFVRDKQDLLSLMTNVTIGLHQGGQKDPNESVRQKNLDAQFETFLHNTLKNSDGIIDGMTPYAAAVAAHAVHAGQHNWGQFRGATDITGVEVAINARIRVMEQQNADARANGTDPPFSFIVPLEQIKRNIKK